VLPYHLLLALTNSHPPPQPDEMARLASWDAALRLAAAPSETKPPSHRSAFAIVEEAGKRTEPLDAFGQLAAPLRVVRTRAELGRVLSALACAPDTERLLKEAADSPTMFLPAPPEVQQQFWARMNARLAAEGGPLVSEVNKVITEQLIPLIRRGEPPHHGEIFGLTPALLQVRPDVPAELAEELLLLFEGHISAAALLGLVRGDSAPWIAEDLVSRAVRGQKSLLKLLAAAGYRVSEQVLPGEERLASLDESFAETASSRQEQRQEAMEALESRRRQRAP